MIFIATPSAGENAYYYSVMRQRNEEEGGGVFVTAFRARYARTILSGVFSRPVLATATPRRENGRREKFMSRRY